MAGTGDRPLALRARADLDIVETIDHYLAESTAAAEGFVEAIEQAFTHIRRAPESGSPRWAHELRIPGLRSWPCGRYPYLVFYMPLPERIEVWRVLHGSRDIPAWLSEDSGPDAPST